MKIPRWLGLVLLGSMATCKDGRVDADVWSGPPAVRLLYPIDQTVITDPTPAFDWTDAPGGVRYQLQCSTSDGFSSTVMDVTVSASAHVPAVPLWEGAKFFWRVRVIDNDSMASRWTATWWFIVGITPPPSATTLIAPLNGTTIAGVPSPRTVVFDWSDVASVEYNLQCSTDPDFTALVTNQWLTTSAWTTSLPYGLYYWRVFTVDPTTWEAAPSVSWFFYVAPIAPPSLLSPPNGASLGSGVVPCDWTDVTGASDYTIEISTASDFSAIVETADVVVSAYTSSDLVDGGYYWRVRTNSPFGPSPWTAPWEFVVDSVPPFLPPGPICVKPINNAKVKDPTPRFLWTSTGSAEYRFQISTSPVFITLLVDEYLASTMYTPTTPIATGVYYWRVRGLGPDTRYSLTRRVYVGIVAGDLNSDGHPEVVLGSGRYDHAGMAEAGRVCVFFGGPAIGGSITADDAPLTFLGTEAGELFGDGVALADINGDLIDDLIIGGLHKDTGAGVDSGRIYIWYGGASFPMAGMLSASSASVMIDGAAAGDKFGFQPDVLGDVNNDGVFDFGVAANRADFMGKADTGAYYVFYGKSVWPAMSSASSAEVKIYGESAGDRLGFHNQGTAGDFNADGYDDVIVASRFHDAPTTDSGRAYVVLGGSALPSTVDLASASGVVFVDSEAQVGGMFGYSAHKIGDVNADGYSDVMIGSGVFDAGIGKAWVVRGRDTTGGTISAGSAEFKISGSGAGAYLSCGIQSSFGDINDDLLDEVAIGEMGYSGGKGRVALYHGSSGLSGAVTVPSGSAASVIGELTGNTFGTTVVVIGDVNGDGVMDLAMNDYTFDTGAADVGKFYLFFGGSSFTGKPGYPSVGAGSADFMVTGTQAGEYFSTVIATIRY